ncbi:MAG: DUF4438 domain-containing protein [Anaerolineaceae bacterium]|nr:DUF4438 domain-containing protein [Anaerolineaceae bacterium]
MLKTNEKNIVEFILQCNPGPPKSRGNWAVDRFGEPFILPSIGGITVNIQIGDSAFGWEGDHVEPGVSCIGDTHKPFEHPNTSLQIFSCSGNKARVISGEAKDTEGVVIGHHGGSEHLIVDFPREAKEKMTYEDKVIIFAKGQGLKLTDYPDITMFNLSPELLSKMNIKETSEGKIQVPVTTLIPAAAMGSGIGVSNNASGDYDIVTGDPQTMEEYKLGDIRFGDIVAVLDHDTRFGVDYRQGAITIGIIVHSDCKLAGHGPGMTVLMTCPSGLIEPVIDPKANIADYYGIGTQTAA